MSREPDRGVRAPDRDSRREQMLEPPRLRRSPDREAEPVRYAESERPGPAASDRQSIEVPSDGAVESPGGGGDA